jgi:exopolysaccharide biosynthesis polyprenyl glycosylphosphotransferase
LPAATSSAELNSEAISTIFRQIARQCRPFCPDDILLLATEQDFSDVQRLAAALSELPASLHMLPIGLHTALSFSKFSEFGLMPTLQLSRQPLSQLDTISKRVFDFIGAALGLIFLSPLMLTVAALIALDGNGLPIFRQLRHGFNNEPIKVFEFRTMRLVEKGTDFTQAVRNDGRVTPLGRILRKTNIDELPQLINVLLGEMSLVGPRPHPIKLNERFDPELSLLFRRHNVKPGITGWAQVNGCRGATDTLEKMKKRLEYDLYYVDHWSFLFDLQIILMTFLSKEAYDNAY